MALFYVYYVYLYIQSIQSMACNRRPRVVTWSPRAARNAAVRRHGAENALAAAAEAGDELRQRYPSLPRFQQDENLNGINGVNGV